MIRQIAGEMIASEGGTTFRENERKLLLMMIKRRNEDASRGASSSQRTDAATFAGSALQIRDDYYVNEMEYQRYSWCCGTRRRRYCERRGRVYVSVGVGG